MKSVICILVRFDTGRKFWFPAYVLSLCIYSGLIYVTREIFEIVCKKASGVLGEIELADSRII